MRWYVVCDKVNARWMDELDVDAKKIRGSRQQQRQKVTLSQRGAGPSASNAKSSRRAADATFKQPSTTKFSPILPHIPPPCRVIPMCQ
jgi:hypothetical protein